MENNITVKEIVDLLHLNISNVANGSDVLNVLTKEELFDFYEAYMTKEKEQIMIFKLVAYVLGSLIILSNIIVVVSSGLIIKKGQEPKSTYLLLGNVSLADTIIGVSIIFGTIVDNTTSSNPLCIFQIGLIVCPTLVSIFSVGLIAVDRYIYILHGLYYQRWFNTTRVRIGILFTWLIGSILGFMPVTGWTNPDLHRVRCYYFSLFPGGLILINTLLSIVPVIVVVILYTIILRRALRNVKTIKKSKNPTFLNTDNLDKLRFYRGNNQNKTIQTNYFVKYNHKRAIRRSLSDFDLNKKYNPNHTTEFVTETLSTINGNGQEIKSTQSLKDISEISKANSKISIWSITSSSTEGSSHNSRQTKRKQKSKDPSKWRATTVVLLTSGCFVVTWVPCFIVIICYVFCENKRDNPKCIKLRGLLGPLGTFAYLNSILNPLIYAWWHKGFKRTLKTYCIKRFNKNKK